MTRIGPQPGPQTQFLATPADIAIYGGAAGGGKTWALLVEPTRHVKNRDFGCVIFRQTFKQISEEGGLWDESERIYPVVKGDPHKNRWYWDFPSGAQVRFSYLQHERDKYIYQGAQIPLIGWDQLEQFSQSQFFYLLSRNRSLCGVKPYVRATCNPDADSWLASFLAWWIDQDTGYADPSKSGAVRCFIRFQEEIVWADSKFTLIKRYPGYFKQVLEATRESNENVTAEDLIHTVTFIPASVYDNRILLRENPEYLARLLALDLIERERLLMGNWKIKAEAGKIVDRAWFRLVPVAPAGGIVCRFWDFAATEKKMAGDNPDFTASTKIKVLGRRFTVVDCTEEALSPTDADTKFVNLSRQDARAAREEGMQYLARWEMEPGAAGKRESVRLTGMLPGIDAKGVPSGLYGDKVQRLKPFAAQAEAGNVDVLEDAWTENWLSHMHHQPEWSHDDISDATAGSFNALADLLAEQEKTDKRDLPGFLMRGETIEEGRERGKIGPRPPVNPEVRKVRL